VSRISRIVAMGGGGFSEDDGAVDDYVMSFVDATRPRVCLLPTATSAVPLSVMRFFDAFPSSQFEPSYLDLFDRRVGDVTSFLGEQDVIYVGGGNTANMLAVWRTHGVDAVLRAAWESGIVLCGTSAGANCWFEACTTDSFLTGTSEPLRDGLGLLSGSFCPHYHGEAERRPSFLRLVGTGDLPAGIACDDGVAVHFEGPDLIEAVATRDDAGAFRVWREGEGAVEEPLTVRRL
jgi:dipeptidase E